MIVELRQYALHPGQWEVLGELFERALAEGQEEVGMSVMGWFRDLDRPDRFVWFRRFRDMPERALALQAFYPGPVWAEHREEANATMIDSTDVLLLRPAGAGASVALGNFTKPFVVSIHQFPSLPGDAEIDRLEQEHGPAWTTFVTEGSPNNFPALPVREEEHVVVRISGRRDSGADEVLRLG
jgi:NIPSNAP